MYPNWIVERHILKYLIACFWFTLSNLLNVWVYHISFRVYLLNFSAIVFDKLIENKMHAYKNCGLCMRKSLLLQLLLLLQCEYNCFLFVIDESTYRLAISRRVSLQHVGYIQSDCYCCVDMKQIRASVHREARFHIRGCANQLNNDNDSNDNHVIMQMEKSKLFQLQRHQQRCHSKFRDQIPAMTTIQQLFWPSKVVSTTMLYVLYLSALYLVVATNVCISGVAATTTTSAATAAVPSTITVTTFVARNNLSGENDIQRHGPVYAALSGAHSNVPTTIAPGE